MLLVKWGIIGTCIPSFVRDTVMYSLVIYKKKKSENLSESLNKYDWLSSFK